jgi:hypothetical protein
MVRLRLSAYHTAHTVCVCWYLSLRYSHSQSITYLFPHRYRCFTDSSKESTALCGPYSEV